MKLYSQNMCHGAMFHLGSMLKLRSYRASCFGLLGLEPCSRSR